VQSQLNVNDSYSSIDQAAVSNENGHISHNNPIANINKYLDDLPNREMSDNRFSELLLEKSSYLFADAESQTESELDQWQNINCSQNSEFDFASVFQLNNPIVHYLPKSKILPLGIFDFDQEFDYSRGIDQTCYRENENNSTLSNFDRLLNKKRQLSF
jgi:hypothetical protein